MGMMEAQHLNKNNFVKIGNDIFWILNAEYNKIARGTANSILRMKNMTTGIVNEQVFRCTDKLEQVQLERKSMQYLYESQGMYTFMDQATYDQVEINKDLVGDGVNWLKEQMVMNIYFHDERPLYIEFPINVELQITYTENAIKGDTSGKVMKNATTETGCQVKVPLFCNIGDVIRIDTRTGEYQERVLNK